MICVLPAASITIGVAHDAGTGRVVEDYWHPGAIYYGVLGDVDRDGKDELVLALRRPADWRPAEGARFEIHFEKARHLAGETGGFQRSGPTGGAA